MVMDEFVGELIPWDLDEHLNGCLAGNQTARLRSLFALEAFVGNRARRRSCRRFSAASQRAPSFEV
jgi:hypothetical protein